MSSAPYASAVGGTVEVGGTVAAGGTTGFGGTTATGVPLRTPLAAYR